MGDFRLQAIKEFVQALYDDPRCLYQEDNILYCEKLFIINCIMSRVYTKVDRGEMNLNQMRNYLGKINDYLNDKVDLSWEDGGLVALEKGRDK